MESKETTMSSNTPLGYILYLFVSSTIVGVGLILYNCNCSMLYLVMILIISPR